MLYQYFYYYKGTGHTIIGEIDEDLLGTYYSYGDAYKEYYVNTGGIYLLPEPVPFNGKIISLKVYGFVDETINVTASLDPFIPTPTQSGVLTTNKSSVAAPFLYVLVYRPSKDGGVLSLAHNLTQLSHGFTPGRLPSDPGQTLDWEVQSGDYIGAYIPRECVNGSDGILMCPSQINLQTDDCLSAFYHPALERVDNLSRVELEEVSLQLNLEAILSARHATSTIMSGK